MVTVLNPTVELVDIPSVVTPLIVIQDDKKDFSHLKISNRIQWVSFCDNFVANIL